jgi:hypothetical protein
MGWLELPAMGGLGCYGLWVSQYKAGRSKTMGSFLSAQTKPTNPKPAAPLFVYMSVFIYPFAQSNASPPFPSLSYGICICKRFKKAVL